MQRTGQISDRIGAVAGIAFALLFFLSVFVFDPPVQATDQALSEFWADGGMRRDALTSMFMMLLAGPCFLIFITQLRDRLRAADPDHAWHDLVYGAGLVFVATLAVTAFLRGQIAHAVSFGGEPLPGPDTLRYATELSHIAFGLAAIPFGTLVIGVASLIIVRTRAVSRWVGWLGLGVTALSLIVIVLQIGPLATPLIVLWAIGVSTQLFRARGVRVATAATVPGMAQSQPPITMPQG